MSQITLLNSYVGSKAGYVNKIDALFDEKCNKYIEPFAGGAAKFFSHYNGKYEKEWINDINANLAVLYKALADENTRTQVMEGILDLEKDDNESIARKRFNENKKKLIESGTKIDMKKLEPEKMIEIAIRTYMAYSQAFDGNATSYTSLKSNTKFKYETRRNLMNAVDRLRSCPLITCHDGVDIIKKYKKNPDIQFLVDLPYVGIYRENSGLYKEEMPGLYEHIKMAQEIADAKAAIVLCGYRCKHEGVPTIYDALLTSDEWHCFMLAKTYKKAEVTEKGRAKKEAIEYVWTNRVPTRAKYYLSMVDYKEHITMEEYWDRIYTACMDGTILDSKELKEYNGTYERLNGVHLVSDEFIEAAKKKEQEKRKSSDSTEK